MKWRFENRHSYLQALQQRIVARAEQAVKEGNPREALQKYQGFMAYYPDMQEVRQRAAELYAQLGDDVRAGRLLLLKESPSEKEQSCIQAFIKSLGGSPTHILKKYLHKERQSISQWPPPQKIQLRRWVELAEIESGCVPRFLKGIKAHLDTLP